MSRHYKPVLWAILYFSSVVLNGQDWDRDSLLAAAMKNNSGYQKTESQSRQARSLLSEARAARLPVLRLVSNLSYMTNPPNVTIKAGDLYPGGNIPFTVVIPPVLPGVTLPPSVDIPIPIPAFPAEDMTISLVDHTRYDFGLTLEQPLFTWGRINNSVGAANLGSQGALLRQEQEKRNLCTTLDSHLYSLGFLAEMQALLAEQKLRAQRLVDLSEESHASGFLLQTDILAARLLLSEISLGELAIAENTATSLLAIQSLAGLDDLGLEAILLPADRNRQSLSYNRSDRERLLHRVMESNLSLKMLNIQTRANEKQLAAFKGRSYGKPELGLFFQLTYGGALFPFFQSGWKEDNSLNMTATLGIRSLLLDGGTMYHSIRQREESLVQFRLDEDKGKRDMVEFLERSLIQLEVSQQRQNYLSLKAETDLVKKDQAEASWRTGYGAERDVLTHELNWYNGRIALLQEELNALLLALRLENVLAE